MNEDRTKIKNEKNETTKQNLEREYKMVKI